MAIVRGDATGNVNPACDDRDLLPSQKSQHRVDVNEFLETCTEGELAELKQSVQDDINKRDRYIQAILKQVADKTLEAATGNQILRECDLDSWLTTVQLRPGSNDEQWDALHELFEATATAKVERKRWSPVDPHQVFAVKDETESVESDSEDWLVASSDDNGLPTWCTREMSKQKQPALVRSDGDPLELSSEITEESDLVEPKIEDPILTDSVADQTTTVLTPVSEQTDAETTAAPMITPEKTCQSVILPPCECVDLFEVVSEKRDYPVEVSTASTECQQIEAVNQAQNQEVAWLLKPTEAGRRLQIIDTVVEEFDHDQLDWVCPEWLDLAVALRQWLEVEYERSEFATPFHRFALAVEQSAVENLRAGLASMGKLTQRAETGETSVEDTVRLLNTHPLFALTETDRELQTAFEEAGAVEIATALCERRLLICQMQVMSLAMLQDPKDTTLKVQCSGIDEVTDVEVASKLPTETVALESCTTNADCQRLATTGVAEELAEVSVTPIERRIEQVSVSTHSPTEIMAESKAVETTVEIEPEETKTKFATREELEQRSKTVKSLVKSLGKFDGTDDFEVFQMQLELIAQIGNWDEHDLLCHLMASLSGRAAETLLCLKGHLSYDEAVDKLRQRFVVQMEPDQARQELYHLEQRHGETVEELAFRAERLAAVIAPRRTPGDREELLVLPAFLDAIEDDEISFELKKIDALNLKMALQKARHLQSLKEMQRVRSPQQTDRMPEETDFENEVSERAETLSWPHLPSDNEKVVEDMAEPALERETINEPETTVDQFALPDTAMIHGDKSSGDSQKTTSNSNRRRRRSPDVVVWNSNQKNRRNRIEGLGDIISHSRYNSDGERSDYSREGSPVRRSRPSRASRQ